MFTLIAVAACGLLAMGSGQAQRFETLEDVLAVFGDSRSTRELKVSGDFEEQFRYVQLLEAQVYQPVDQAVIDHVAANPEYQGKRVMTHDFRTPGSDTISVNTDRDVRVLVEVEPNRWIEVPVNQWEDVYYREFARHTDFPGSVSAASPAELAAHADRYRQLPTDRFHREASLDYTDQGSMQYTVDEQGQVIRRPGASSTVRVDSDGTVTSTSQIARVKRGEGLLLDPEGLALMYQEKAADQLRRADILARQAQEMAWDNPRRVALESQQHMYEAESLMQTRKAVTSLNELRDAYRRMGYDVGQLPDGLRNVFAEIQGLTGSHETDVQRVRELARQTDVQSLEQLNRVISGQMESLKFARSQTVPPTPERQTAPPQPTASPQLTAGWQRASTAANWGSSAVSLQQAYQRAQQGSHVLINFDADDTTMEWALKTAGVAALDLIPEMMAAMKLAPISIMDAMERGWQADIREQRFLEERIRMGEDGTWVTHPLTSTIRVMGRVTYDTVRAMTVDPLLLGVQAGVEGYGMTSALLDELLAHDGHMETRSSLQAQREDFHQRAEAAALSFIQVEADDGRSSLAGLYQPGEWVTLSVIPREDWESWYGGQWEWEERPGASRVMQRESVTAADGHRIRWRIPESLQGTVTVRFRLFDEIMGLQLDYVEAVIHLAAQPRLGTLRSELEFFGGPDAGTVVDHGAVLAFTVTPVGAWQADQTLTWSVAGETWKSGVAVDEDSQRWLLDTQWLDKQPQTVFVQLWDSAGNRLDSRQMSLEFADMDLDDEEEPVSILWAYLGHADSGERLTEFAPGDTAAVWVELAGDRTFWPVAARLDLLTRDQEALDVVEYSALEQPGTFILNIPPERLTALLRPGITSLLVELTVRDAAGNEDMRVFEATWETEPEEELAILAPPTIASGQWYRMELAIPPHLQEPLWITLEFSSALEVDCQSGWSHLRVRGHADNWLEHAWIHVSGWDAAERLLDAFVSFDVLPEPSPNDAVSGADVQREEELFAIWGLEYIEPGAWYEFDLIFGGQLLRPYEISVETSPGLTVQWQPGWDYLRVKGEMSDWPIAAWICVSGWDAADQFFTDHIEVDVLSALPGWQDTQPAAGSAAVEERASVDEDLFAAIRRGDRATVERLVHRGADIHRVKDSTSYPYTPLMEAAMYGHPEIIQLLLDAGADPAVTNAYRQHALMVAIMSHQDAIDRITAVVDSDIEKHDYLDYYTSALVSLLAPGSVNVNQQDHSDRTALHYAAQNGMVETVFALMHAGANANISAGPSTGTAVDIAERMLRHHELQVEGMESRGETHSERYHWNRHAVTRIQRMLSALGR